MKKQIAILSETALLVSFLVAATACGGGKKDPDFDPNDDTKVSLIDPKTYKGEQITLRYWNGFTGEDGQGMKDIINAFNTEYQNVIKVEQSSYVWDIFFQKLLSSKSSPNTAPHVLALPANRTLGYLEKGMFMPMPQIESKLNAVREDYIESAWDVGYYGKTTRYSFPLDVHPNALFYNKDIVNESEIPTTWDEFLSIAKDKTTGTQYGCPIPNEYSITKDIFLSMLVQRGGNVFDSNNNIIFNSKTGADTLQEMVDWKYKEEISPALVGADGDKTLFCAGKSAFYFDGPWVINQLDKFSALDYGVAPMPGSIGENGISWAGSHQLSICNYPVKNYLEKSACYTLIDYICKHGQKWAESGQVPALKSIHSTPEYKALTKLQAFTQEAYKATFGSTNYKYCYEGYNYVGVAVKNSLNDKTVLPGASLNKQAGLLRIYIEDDQ